MAMTTSHSMETTSARKIVWTAMVLLAVAAAACGGSTQPMTGTAPSLVTPVATASDGADSFGLLKEGKGKRPDATPTIGTTPDPDDADAEDGAAPTGGGHHHGKATIQIEGFTTSIDGTCPALTIVINNVTVSTVDAAEFATEFQRATCEAIAAAGESPVHLHIAAQQQDDVLVAVYVRIQGPKGEDGDDAEDQEDETPTTTTPTTGTTPK
jgi:hypothetical protein